MIDDITPPAKRKPKVIEPLVVTDKQPLESLLAEQSPAAQDDIYGTGKTEAAPPIAANKPEANTTVARSDKNVKMHSSRLRKLRFQWPPSRKQALILSAVAVIVAFGSGAAWTHFHKVAPVAAIVVKPKPVKPKPVVPTTVPSTLSGLPVAPEVNKRPVTAVMIENSIDARPQSGLDQAGVVFEAVAEGGVTRFMALFQDTQPDYIGPVRSARPYYIAWALGFDAGYAHVGGSPDGLADIKAWNVRDLDQFYNAGAYQRVSSRYAPHNVYTSIAQLNSIEQAKGYTSSYFTGFARKADQPYKAPAANQKPADGRTPITSIDMSLSGYYYNPHFDYDPATNTYKRSEEGKPHMEINAAGAQTQITPKVVIGIVVPESQGALDASGAFYSDYNPIGNGQAYVFQDGTVTTGTWTKQANTSQLSFTDASGAAIKLNAGQTWVTAITGTNQITYK